MLDAPSFAFETKARTVEDRFDDFIAWAEPGGLGGFDRFHVERYKRGEPFFSYSAELMPHSHVSSRSWFVRREFERPGATRPFLSPRGAALPQIRNPLAMIRDGRFLHFAKAYLNVYCAIRTVRGAPKATVKALIFLEKALRDLNAGDNDPTKLAHLTFQRAALSVQRSRMVESQKFDIGKALEHLAALLQAGGRFKGDKKHASFPGFKLIAVPFSFRSPVKSPPKFGKKRPTEDEAVDSGHLSSEEVTAVGLAYRKAADAFGKSAAPTFYAGLISLPLLTASMRASELQSLRSDALHATNGRHRLRVPRPKIGIEQDVPISKRLGPLAAEIFEVVKDYSSEARAAFSSYIKQSPDGPSGVHTLFIPRHIKPLLKPAYLTKEQVHQIISPEVKPGGNFPQSVKGRLPVIHFVSKFGDIYGQWSKWPMVKLRDVIEACRGVKITLPSDAHSSQYVSARTARRLIDGGGSSKAVILALRALFSSNKALKCTSYVARDDLIQFLLNDFKTSIFPHWPFTSKDRSVRLDSALAVLFDLGTNGHLARGELQREQWWLPRLLSVPTLNSWVSGNSTLDPRLFVMTKVKISGDRYPRISVQRTRRYHHTSALLAGANPLFANELAGRQSGWQGEAYDYRTPREIVRQSIDTYDPDQNSEFIGPVADQAPPPKRVVDRRIFLAEHAAPKHVTEIGGCRTDWVLDPCDFHGDCIRCGKHIWRKGDNERVPRIVDLKDEAQRAIKKGALKLRSNPRLKSIEKQVRQQVETLDRCDEILRIEANESIEVGTIVTFAPAPSAMSLSELWSRLRQAERG